MPNDNAPGTPPKNILVLEDDTIVQNLYKDLLTGQGYNTLVSSTVDQAIDIAKNYQISLVLLDIMLPGGKNGYDFLEEMQADPSLKKIPILVLSNLNKDSKAEVQMGVVEWFVKSNVSAPEVIDKITSIIKNNEA